MASAISAIDEIRATKGLLRLLPDDPEKLPLDFEFETVTFQDFSFEHAGRYTAQLTNPKPKGLILSSGWFGPWNTYAPRSTPLSGDYEFTNARLDTIKGIGGTLNSTGSFEGVLERISVKGTTTTPDFQLDLARQPLNLDTRFAPSSTGRAATPISRKWTRRWADRISWRRDRWPAYAARRDERSRSTSPPMVDSRTFCGWPSRLRSRAMRGGIALTTSLVIPPGEIDVVQRLQLKGSFKIRRGQFTSDTVQDKVDELSRRGRGEPENEAREQCAR